MWMRIREAQKRMREFEEARGWSGFRESQIFTHLVEEVSEIGRHILVREGYKAPGLGHAGAEGEAWREFAQVFSLLLQLANRFEVDLEEAFKHEIEIMERRFPAEEWRRYMKDSEKG